MCERLARAVVLAATETALCSGEGVLLLQLLLLGDGEGLGAAGFLGAGGAVGLQYHRRATKK